jgi:hypothetical protein
VTAAEVVLAAVPGPAVTDALQAAGPLDGRIVIDAANSFGQQQLSLRSLASAFPLARWLRAFSSLSVNVMADDNNREPPWVLFLSGDEQAKPAVAQLIRDAGFDPVDLGGIDDSQLQDPGSALRTYTLTHDEATALVARGLRGRDLAVVQDKWDGIRGAFHGFDPAQVAAMTPAQLGDTSLAGTHAAESPSFSSLGKERNRDHEPSFPGFMIKFTHDTALTQFTDGGGIRFASVSPE